VGARGPHQPRDPGGARIFLSEHTGDARPDALLYLYVEDVDAVATQFGVDPVDAPYGMREIEVRDPDGNRGLGEHTGLCDRDARDIAERVDVGEPGALDRFRRAVDGDPDEQVVWHGSAAFKSRLL